MVKPAGGQNYLQSQLICPQWNPYHELIKGGHGLNHIDKVVLLWHKCMVTRCLSLIWAIISFHVDFWDKRMNCFLDATNSFFKLPRSIATCRYMYLKELELGMYTQDKWKYRYLRKPQQQLKFFMQISQFFCGGVLVTVYCSLGMLMFTFIYSPIA